LVESWIPACARKTDESEVHRGRKRMMNEAGTINTDLTKKTGLTGRECANKESPAE